MELNIYSKDGSLKLTVSPSDSSTVTEEVGGECSVSLSFDTFEFRPIEVNDYIEVAGVRYKARMAYRPKMKNRQAYSYSLRFYAPIHDAQQALMKTETDGGLISEFSLWGGPREHLQKWVDNMNRLAGSELWSIGSVITGENKNIDYRNVNCWDAAFGSNGIASTYETEMWADGYVINLCKCERGERVTLGYGNGLTGLTPEDNSDKVRFFTRLFPLGSTRNINVSTYGSSRLQLPSRATFVDHNTDRYGVFEDSEEDAFAGIFPQYIGTVTAVRSESKTDENGKQFTVYYIKDSGITWEPKALPEQTFMLSFQTGDLQGYGDDTNKSFQAEWHKDTKEWEIINIWLDENTQIPGGNIVPIVGNQYFPWNMIMPQEYITEAEKRYEAAVNDFVANYSGEPVAYSGSTDYIHCAKQAVPLRIGQNVRLESDLYFEEGYQNTRITKVVRKLCRLTDATVTFAEQIGTGWKKSVDNQLSSLHYELQRQVQQAGIDVIKTTDTKTPSDNNVFSALRSLATFLRKDKADSTNYLLTMLAGAVFGDNKAEINADGFLTAVKAILQNIVLSGDLKSDNFLAGVLGSGYALIKRDADGKSYLEVDKLFARVKAIFAVLEIMKVTYTGGNFVFSPAGMQCTKVEEYENYYRCYFTADDGEKAVENTFEVDDFVQLREFNVKPGIYENVSNRYFWRRCIAKGDDYIDLSKTDRDMTSNDAPMVGDSLVTIGNKTIKSRQNVIIISVYGEGSPSIIQYSGINDYSLDGKAVTVISPNGNKFTGSFVIQSSSKNIEDEISDLNSKIESVEQKSVLAEYSANKVDWHPSFVEGDVWMRTSSDNGITWGEAIRIVGVKGEDGKYTVIEFARNTSLTEAPSSGWSSTPPTSQSGYYIWMRTGTVTPPSTIPVWSNPVRQTGEAGIDGQNVYRLDLTNEVDGVACNSEGTPTGSLPSTNIYVYNGEELDSGWTFKATYSGCSGTISNGVLTITALTADNATATVTASKSGKPTLNSVMSIYKVKAGAAGSDGVGVKSTVVTYQVGTSGTTTPTGTWSSTIPSVEEGKYLWTKTLITYTNGETSTSYSVAKMGEKGDAGVDGDGIVSVENTYQIGASGSVPPTGTWSQAIPAPQKGKYLWTKTVTTYKKSSATTTYSVSYYGTDGTNASYVTVSGEQIFKYTNNFEGIPTPTSIILSAALVGTSGYQWSYKRAGQTTFTNISGATSSTYTLTHNNSTVWGSAKSVTIRCTSGGKHDEITIAKVSDGAKGDKGDQGERGLQGLQGEKGEAGASAYTILLGNESHSFAGTTNAAIPASTRCDIMAFKGTTKVAATIGRISGLPTGMSASVSSNGTTTAYITFTVSSQMVAKQGTINIPITVDGKSFTKQFSFSLSLQGSGGQAAVVFSIKPSATSVIKSSTGVLTPTSITCAKYKTVGNGTATITTEKTLKYQRLGVDSVEIAYSGAVTITDDTKSVVFSLYDGSTLLDRENVPVLSDASDLVIGVRNIVKNSNFSKGTTGWNLNQTTSQVKTDGVYGTYLEFKHAGVGDVLNNRISQAPFYTGKWHEVGKTYSLSFCARAEKSVKINAGEALHLNSFTVTTEWERYSVTYVAENAGSLTFNVAEANVLLSLTQIKLEESTKSTDWSPAPEDVEISVSDAKKAAEEAQATADQAQSDADAANSELGMIASDNYITPSEKTALKQQQADIQAERNEIIANATRYGVSTTAYSSAYTAANNALSKYTASNPQNIQVGTDYANISAYYAARKTILDAIAAAAKKLVTDLDNDLQGYKSEVTQKFEAVDGRFTSAINETKTYTDNAIGAVKVGGRNLLWNTNKGSGKWGKTIYNGVTNIISEVIRNVNSAKITVVSASTSYHVITFEIGEAINNIKRGNQYVLSMDVLSSVDMVLFPRIMKPNGTDQIVYYPNSSIKANTWTHVSAVATLAGQDSYYKNGQVVYLMGFNKIGTYYIQNLKLEEGNKETPWSPAPEDLTTRIEENSSKIEQLPDQISLTVKKEITGGGFNYITNTQSSVEVTGKNIANQIISNNWKINKDISGKTYGGAFKIKFEGCAFSSSSSVVLQAGNSGGWGYNGLTGYKYVSENKEYIVYRNTNKAPIVSGDGDIRVRIDYVSGGKITISEIRAYDVPEGLTDALPWYPSKWDTEVLSSEIKQTAESISLKVNQAIGGENLIDNSSFSQNLSGWNINDSTNTIASIVNSPALGGPCLSLSTKKTYAGIFRALSDQGKCYVEEGAVFTTSFDLYKGSSLPSRLRIGMEDKGLTDENILDLSDHPISTWKRVSVTQTMKSTSASFIIYAMSDQMSIVFIRNLKVERGSVATPWVESDNERLLSTGIDILNRKMIFTANNTLIQDNSGNKIAMFTNVGGKPLLAATNIDVDNLKVKHLDGADGTFSGNLNAAGGTFSGNLNAAGGTFSGSITANGARIGGFTIRDNVMRSDVLNTGISFSNGELSNLFLNQMYKQSLWVDDGINNYHSAEKEFTIRTNRTCNMTTPGAGTNLFIADVMNLKYKTMIKSGRYGLQYAMMGSGHIVQDGVVDGGCWYSPGFTANNQVHIITPFDQGNRICVTTEYTRDILVLPTLDKLLQMLGVGVATRVGTQFSFALTIINASSKTVYVMGKADFTVGDVSFNFDQYPTFYNASGTLINSENGYALAGHRSRQFMLTYDGTNYMAFEL